MTYDDGIAIFYKLVNVADPGDKPQYQPVEVNKQYFGFETIGSARYYNAMTAGINISYVIHVPFDMSIKTSQEVVLDEFGSDDRYRIAQIQHAIDNDGVRFTRLTLELIDNEDDQ